MAVIEHYVLAGHTHGGQIRIPVIGSLVLPIDNKKLDYGHFDVKNTHMYVTSGVGFATRARFRCPPEVPVFTLEASETMAHSAAPLSND